MVWPLRYSRIVEQGKCASGSSSGLGCGAVAVLIPMFMFSLVQSFVSRNPGIVSFISIGSVPMVPCEAYRPVANFSMHHCPHCEAYHVFFYPLRYVQSRVP